jgi:preprotein translocase subunit SecG
MPQIRASEATIRSRPASGGDDRPLRATTSRLSPMATVLSVVEVLISVILIFLVLLHSGKDAGLSGAFGIGGGGSAFGGGSLVERNLTRWTIFFGVLWALNAIVILKL